MRPDEQQQQFGGKPGDSAVYGIRGWEIYRTGSYTRDEKCIVCALYWGRHLMVGVQGYHWTPGENLAVCGYECPSLANPECVCGFYAYWGFDWWLTAISHSRIMGIIEGYGNITLGTKGFRCSKAKILAMVVPGNYRGFGVEQLYSDVQVFTNIDTMLAEFPTTDVENYDT